MDSPQANEVRSKVWRLFEDRRLLFHHRRGDLLLLRALTGRGCLWMTFEGAISRRWGGRWGSSKFWKRTWNASEASPEPMTESPLSAPQGAPSPSYTDCSFKPLAEQNSRLIHHFGSFLYQHESETVTKHFTVYRLGSVFTIDRSRLSFDQQV